MKQLVFVIFCFVVIGLHGQSVVISGAPLNRSSTVLQSSIDTLLPKLATDSCVANSTYYLLNNRIISGAAVLNDGSVISRVAQAFDSGTDSIRIGSIFAELVYAHTDSGDGQFVVEIYSEQDLQTPLGQSLPVSGNLLTDTSGPTIYNDFFFANPVNLQGKFWVALNVVDGGDSIYLASTGDDCGMGGGIYNNGQDWQYYRDQFTVNSSDPLDIALKFGVVMERIVDLVPHEIDNLLSVFPNPAKEEIQIDLPDFQTKAKVRLTSTSGKSILFTTNYASGDRLRLDDLESGMYLLEVIQGELRFSSKLIIIE